MNAIPMHAWHPIMIHLPLIAFAVAVLFDLVDSWCSTPRSRHAAAGYLGGELVFHHAVGIHTARLKQVVLERGNDEGHDHVAMQGMTTDSVH